MTVRLFGAAAEPASWTRAVEIRTRVFIVEQGVPISEELDSHDEGDATCVHALVDIDGRPVATGRLYEPEPGTGKIGRMAVLEAFRGTGAGMLLLDALIKEGRRRGLTRLELDSQVHAIGFYGKRGFTTEGSPFMDCGIPHQRMVLHLDRTDQR